MKCKVCDQYIPTKDRSLPRNKDFYPKDNIWFIETNEHLGYDLVFTYDCGYAADCIKDIKFCPMCGRKLDNNKDTIDFIKENYDTIVSEMLKYQKEFSMGCGKGKRKKK